MVRAPRKQPPSPWAIVTIAQIAVIVLLLFILD